MSIDFEAELSKPVDAVSLDTSDFSQLKNSLDGLMTMGDGTLDTLLDLDSYDPATRKMPLWVTLLEKSIKKSLVQYTGILPKPLASLYTGYLLEAIEWMNKELAKASFYEKKVGSNLKRTMAQEKSQAKMDGKDSETARERWVLEQSVPYTKAEESSNKAYAFLNYLKSRADSLNKEYYLCYSFMKFTEGVSLNVAS